jgi:hypothetical protein
MLHFCPAEYTVGKGPDYKCAHQREYYTFTAKKRKENFEGSGIKVILIYVI